MDINYYKRYEPVFNSWYIKEPLGEGGFGKVFAIERHDYGTYRAALKTITIPQSKSEIDSVKADGMDEESVTSYFKHVVDEIVGEIVLMSKLKGNSTIVSYEDHVVMKHEDGIGWDILIRMELLNPLLNQTIYDQFTNKDVTTLGIDMCTALELCQLYNIIHRDIKPENIFISETGSYKLGDFGIARTIERTTSGLSKKGTFTYMAPEVYKGDQYGSSVDIYSLGLVMYRLLNNNRAPFLPAFPEPITHTDREKSIIKRVGGTPIPPPVNADERLAGIVLKACAYRAQDRYSSPSQMKSDLEKFLAGETIPKYHTNIVHPEPHPEPHTGSQSGSYAGSTEQKCDNCGTVIPNANYMFCDKCGKPVKADVSGEVFHSPQQPVSTGYTPHTYENNPAPQQSYGAHSYERQQYNPQSQQGVSGHHEPKRSKNVIIAVVAGCAVLFGIGLYMAIGSGTDNNARNDRYGGQTGENGSTPTPEPENDKITIDNVVNMMQENAKQVLENQGFIVDIDEVYNNDIPEGRVISQTPAAGNPETHGSTIRILVSMGPRVDAIYLSHEGNRIIELFLRVTEEISLDVIFEPAGSYADVDWVSGDSNVFRVFPDRTGTGAIISAVSPGSAGLTIRAGSATYICTVIISPFEPYHGTRLRYIYDNMERRNTGVYLGVYWTSGRYTGDTTELVRDAHSDVWFMYGVNDNNREVFPTFDYDGTAYLMRFERVGLTVYYFLEDGTGYFLDANGENWQDFVWDFWTY